MDYAAAYELQEQMHCMAQEYENWLKQQEQMWFEETNEIDFKADNRDLYKLDFTRPRIQDQVIERKPRHLVKKVIR